MKVGYKKNDTTTPAIKIGVRNSTQALCFLNSSASGERAMLV